MINAISTYLKPRVSAGALFAFSASVFATGCPADPGVTTETSTGTETDTADTLDTTGSTGDPGPLTDPGTTSTSGPIETGTVTDTSTTSPTTGATTGTDTGDTTTDDTTTGDTTTGGETETSTTTGAVEETTSTGADTTGSTGTSTGDTEETGEPIKPDDCVDLALAGIELVSQQEHQYDSSGSVPLVRTPAAQTSITGDPALFDLLRILFDGDLGIGVHTLDPDPNHAIPGFVTSFVTVSNAAVVYQEDQANNAYTKVFVATAGELEIVEMLSSHQTRGRVQHVELREMVTNPDTEELELKPDGTCYWIEEAEYDVRRPQGCTPFKPGACADDQYCMPTNAIGSDGECVAGGAKQEGEACALTSPMKWDSDCAPGLRCIDFGDGPECGKVCDVLSDAPGCPAGTHCGGGYNLCLDEALLQMSGIDPAPLGEPCVDNPTALYCGGEGRPGHCYDDDAAGPLPSTCLPFLSAPSQCIAPQTAGYVGYKSGIDRSTLWCLTP